MDIEKELEWRRDHDRRLYSRMSDLEDQMDQAKESIRSLKREITSLKQEVHPPAPRVILVLLVVVAAVVISALIFDLGSPAGPSYWDNAANAAVLSAIVGVVWAFCRMELGVLCIVGVLLGLCAWRDWVNNWHELRTNYELRMLVPSSFERFISAVAYVFLLVGARWALELPKWCLVGLLAAGSFYYYCQKAWMGWIEEDDFVEEIRYNEHVAPQMAAIVAVTVIFGAAILLRCIITVVSRLFQLIGNLSTIFDNIAMSAVADAEARWKGKLSAEKETASKAEEEAAKAASEKGDTDEDDNGKEAL